MPTLCTLFCLNWSVHRVLYLSVRCHYVKGNLCRQFAHCFVWTKFSSCWSCFIYLSVRCHYVKGNIICRTFSHCFVWTKFSSSSPCFIIISVCPFVGLLKATYAEHLHIVLSELSFQRFHCVLCCLFVYRFVGGYINNTKNVRIVLSCP